MSNSLDLHTKEFYNWWWSSSRVHYGHEVLEIALSGWNDCISQAYLIQSHGYKLRGTTSRDLGWNAAVDFILKGDSDE